MKRWLIIVAVLLTAGAVVNVAVAWGCAASVEAFDGEEIRRTLHMRDRWWVVIERRALGSTLVWSLKGGGQLEFDASRFVVESEDDMLPHWAPIGDPSSAITDARGFPARTMFCSGVWHLSPSLAWIATLRHGGIELPSDGTRWRALPLRPIWPGFAANTLFYAALLWLPFAVRRFIRVRRGLCPACCYPMGESAVCTECGKALPGHARAVT